MESLHAHSLRTFPSLCLAAITQCHPADPDSYQVMDLSKVSPQTLCPLLHLVQYLCPRAAHGASRKIPGIALVSPLGIDSLFSKFSKIFLQINHSS